MFDRLDSTFAALADPTRRAILARLALGETSVSELAGPFDMSLPAVMKHLDCLERAGLLSAQKDGRVRRFTVKYLGEAFSIHGTYLEVGPPGARREHAQGWEGCLDQFEGLVR